MKGRQAASGNGATSGGAYQLTVEAHFSAAHALRGYKGKCENLHGHNWRVRLAVEGDKLDAAGLLIDFADLNRSLAGVVSELDHKHLNDDVPHFRHSNPTTEEIAHYVADRVAGTLPEGVSVAWVEVEEAPGSVARFRPAL